MQAVQPGFNGYNGYSLCHIHSLCVQFQINTIGGPSLAEAGEWGLVAHEPLESMGSLHSTEKKELRASTVQGRCSPPALGVFWLGRVHQEGFHPCWVCSGCRVSGVSNRDASRSVLRLSGGQEVIGAVSRLWTVLFGGKPRDTPSTVAHGPSFLILYPLQLSPGPSSGSFYPPAFTPIMRCISHSCLPVSWSHAFQ